MERDCVCASLISRPQTSLLWTWTVWEAFPCSSPLALLSPCALWTALTQQDCMLLMGLKETVYWLSWTLTYAATSLLTSLVLVSSLHIPFVSLFLSISAAPFVLDFRRCGTLLKAQMTQDSSLHLARWALPRPLPMV